MITFAQLAAHPALLTDALRSPMLHADGTMTLLWEGMPPDDPLYYQGEWMEHPAPLTYLEECDIWGADITAPPLPPTVCSWLRIGTNATFLRASLPSWRHEERLLGPDVPPLPPRTIATSSLFAELRLPSPALATPARRIRLFAPGATYRDAVYVLDGASFAGSEHDFPAALDALHAQGGAPPTLVVAVDSAGPQRPTEYLPTGARNVAAREWFASTLVPYIQATYGVERHWLVGASNGASFALQLLFAEPAIFAGGVCCSPWHGDGLPVILAAAQQWRGDARIFISHGAFGFGETLRLPGSQSLAALLARNGRTIRFHEAPGYGHTEYSWSLLFPIGLRWLFATPADR